MNINTALSEWVSKLVNSRRVIDDISRYGHKDELKKHFKKVCGENLRLTGFGLSFINPIEESWYTLHHKSKKILSVLFVPYIAANYLVEVGLLPQDLYQEHKLSVEKEQLRISQGAYEIPS